MIEPKDFSLVIGAGSIGERYIRNLWAIGRKNIVVLRREPRSFRDIGDAKVNVVTSWQEAEQFGPKVAFVCTPTSLHLENTMECLRRGMHVLVEKPLSHSITGLDDLLKLASEKNLLVQVGYMMRHHPLIKKVCEFRDSGVYGNLLHIHSYWGEYLPDWHPWEDYRISYAAKKTLGGGAALTLSHDLDLSNWIANAGLENAHATFNYSSPLEVDVDSGADFILQYRNGVTSHVHVNYFQKVKERWYRYIFTDAVVNFDYFSNTIEIKSSTGNDAMILESFDRNDLFISQLEDFFLNTNTAEKTRDYINESRQIIELCNQEKTPQSRYATK